LRFWPLLLRGHSWKTRVKFSSFAVGSVFGIGLLLYAALPVVREAFRLFSP